jgi:Bardet-Biedl syndrome 4 protein
MGSICLDKGQIDEAIDLFTKAHKVSANSSVLWNNIGVGMAQKNKMVAAYCCFKRALFLDPFRWDIHANLALIFISRKKYLPAEIHLRSALKLSKDATLFNLLGMCLS